MAVSCGDAKVSSVTRNSTVGTFVHDFIRQSSYLMDSDQTRMSQIKHNVSIAFAPPQTFLKTSTNTCPLYVV